MENVVDKVWARARQYRCYLPRWATGFSTALSRRYNDHFFAHALEVGHCASIGKNSLGLAQWLQRCLALPHIAFQLPHFAEHFTKTHGGTVLPEYIQALL